MEDNELKEFQWIIQAHVVVSTRNPCLQDDAKQDDNDNKEEEADHSSTDVCTTIDLGSGLVIKVDHIVAVNNVGIITHMEPARQFFARIPREKCHSHRGFLAITDTPNAFLCPGLIDLHIHAPQYAFAGTGTDRPLMGPTGWLETYTFPTEAGMRDLNRARKVYQAVVKRTLSLGTTTAVYFATLDLEPTKLLIDIVLENGQRALIGKVCMDRNAPEFYCQSTEQNLKDIREAIEYVLNHPSPRQQPETASTPLVLPLVTPRFIPTCSPALMEGLGAIAKEYQCHITSHISESFDEVKFSKALAQQDYGNNRLGSDADVFHSHSLLTNKCIMAHGVHLTENDLDLMKQHGSAVAHCPLSNFFFAGGSLPCKHIMKRGNKVGLGTDIAGGYHPSMIESARSAVVASLSLKHQSEKQQPLRSSSNDVATRDVLDPSIDYRHAFWLSTLGGADALGLQDRIGSLNVGMEFDAVVLAESPAHSWPDNLDDAGDALSLLGDVFQRLWNLGDDRNITYVFVQGRLVRCNLSE